jgi:hypothetical protein
MCTRPADHVYNKGIRINVSEIFSLSSANPLYIGFEGLIDVLKPKKGHCLTYNKEMAMNSTDNPLIGDVLLFSDKDIGSVKALLPLDTLNRYIINGTLKNGFSIIKASDLMKDTLYTFTVIGKTSKGEVLTASASVQVKE